MMDLKLEVLKTVLSPKIIEQLETKLEQSTTLPSTLFFGGASGGYLDGLKGSIR